MNKDKMIKTAYDLVCWNIFNKHLYENTDNKKLKEFCKRQIERTNEIIEEIGELLSDYKV